jgi:1-acyl-sn-glycerol-3-phosphate acyltransferase
MGPALVMICSLALFIRSELWLRFVARVRPERLMDLVTRFQPSISRRLFIFARILGGLRTDFAQAPAGIPKVALIVSNHQSLVDIPALAVSFPFHALRYVAKRELSRGVPYVSTSLRLGRHALISRTGDYRQGQAELRRFASLADAGICPVVFPEGTRSRTGKVRPFYAGAVRIILEHRPMPVLSVAVDGGYRMSTVPRLLGNMRGTHYRVKPLTLYPAPHGKREIIDLLGTVEKEISAQVNAWRRGDARPKVRA